MFKTVSSRCRRHRRNTLHRGSPLPPRKETWTCTGIGMLRLDRRCCGSLGYLDSGTARVFAEGATSYVAPSITVLLRIEMFVRLQLHKRPLISEGAEFGLCPSRSLRSDLLPRIRRSPCDTATASRRPPSAFHRPAGCRAK
jgi:hypothetical protein